MEQIRNNKIKKRFVVARMINWGGQDGYIMEIDIVLALDKWQALYNIEKIDIDIDSVIEDSYKKYNNLGTNKTSIDDEIIEILENDGDFSAEDLERVTRWLFPEPMGLMEGCHQNEMDWEVEILDIDILENK